jgi:uncharacterized integral membrane protein
MAYVVVAVVAVAVAVFTMQNTASVTVRFLIWQIEEVPLAAVILSALVTGGVIVGVPLGLGRWRLRRQLRDRRRDLPPAINRADSGADRSGSAVDHPGSGVDRPGTGPA